MEKTTVYLTTQQKAALSDAARAEGRSEARLIRDGIDGVLSRHRVAEETIGLPGAPLAVELPVGDLAPRPRWISREGFTRRFADVQADAALRRELRELAPDMTDRVPDR